MRARRTLGLLLLGSLSTMVLALTPERARAQVGAHASSAPSLINDAFAAPGNYGMAYGSMSAGVPRTYTAFTSPYGLGYSYGYAPPSFLPGPYGLGLWRPAAYVPPGYPFNASSYRTFPVPYTRGAPISRVPIGWYAPGFGPPSPLSYPPPDMGW